MGTVHAIGVVGPYYFKNETPRVVDKYQVQDISVLQMLNSLYELVFRSGMELLSTLHQLSILFCMKVFKFMD